MQDSKIRRESTTTLSECASRPSTGITGEGQLFENAEHFRRVLKTHAIMMNRSFTYIKNEKNRIVVVCSETECPWRIRASLHKNDGTFGIRTCNLKHSCGVDNLKDRGHPKADANWIAYQIREKVKTDPSYKPCVAVNDIHRAFGVVVPYHRAWVGKELAVRDIHGDECESFDKLRWFCDVLRETNPGSIADLEIFPDTMKFRRIFISIAACVAGFVKGCRPMLFLDGTHIKSKWKGCLLSAVCKDADNGMFTVAYAGRYGDM